MDNILQSNLLDNTMNKIFPKKMLFTILSSKLHFLTIMYIPVSLKLEVENL